MLMVLAIVGILGTMSYSYMVGAKPHAELERAEIQVVNIMNLARKHALSEEVTTRVLIDTATGGMTTEYQDPEDGSWVQLGATQTLAGSVSFDADGLTLANNEARFTPRGTLHWGGSITLVSSDNETSVLNANIATGKFPLVGGNLR
jgi:Tfp pilus assembly protein FimT